MTKLCAQIGKTNALMVIITAPSLTRATTGPAPNIDWTVALEFLTKNEYFKNHVSKPNKRYIDVPEPKARNKAPPIKVLAQIIPTGIHETVTTLNTLMFNLSFCPDSQTTQRYLLILIY